MIGVTVASVWAESSIRDHQLPDSIYISSLGAEKTRDANIYVLNFLNAEALYLNFQNVILTTYVYMLSTRRRVMEWKLFISSTQSLTTPNT